MSGGRSPVGNPFLSRNPTRGRYVPKPFLAPDDPAECASCREVSRLRRDVRTADYEASCHATDENLARRDAAHTAYATFLKDYKCTC